MQTRGRCRDATRETEFLVSMGGGAEEGARGDKNRETLYRFVGRAAFTIFLRADVRRKTPTNRAVRLPRFPSRFLFP